MDLGAPIGSHTHASLPAGEHGAGTGLSGGHGVATSQNTQAGRLAQEDGFNGGLGGQHASGAIPSGTPIADKFSGGGASGERNTPDIYGQSGTGLGVGSGGGKLDNSLDQYSGERGAGYGGSEDAVSGSYAGGGTRDGLTGQTGHTTGSGVGPLAENLGSQGQGHSHHHHHHHEHQEHHGARDAALAGTAGAAAGTVGREDYESAYGQSKSSAASTAPLQRAEGVAGLGGGMVPGVGGIQGSGIGPNDSEGERYSTERRDPGFGNLEGASQGAGYTSGSGVTTGAGVGAGLAGAGAYGASHGDHHQDRETSGAGGKIAEGGLSGTGGQGVKEPGTGGGHFGRAQNDDSTGKPLSDAKDLDTGNPHSLVYDEASGKYVHRRDLEGHGSGRA